MERMHGQRPGAIRIVGALALAGPAERSARGREGVDITRWHRIGRSCGHILEEDVWLVRVHHKRLACRTLAAAELVHKCNFTLQLGHHLMRCQEAGSNAAKVTSHPNDFRGGSAVRGGGCTSTLPHDVSGLPSSSGQDDAMPSSGGGRMSRMCGTCCMKHAQGAGRIPSTQ